jgi:hypothetical protein
VVVNYACHFPALFRRLLLLPLHTHPEYTTVFVLSIKTLHRAIYFVCVAIMMPKQRTVLISMS